MERESERERENENGQTSFSMQISTKYGSGNKRITKTMLQELITFSFSRSLSLSRSIFLLEFDNL
jgi:hypothetical protein